MTKQKERKSLATEMLSDMKKQLTGYRIALIISLIGNIIMAIVLIFRFGWTIVAKSGNEVVRWARFNEYC